VANSIIKVKDIMFPRFTAPDLDQAETFLTDFGMERSARTDRALYMRGVDGEHHVHVTELGDPGFIGVTFEAQSAEDLSNLAGAEGLVVEPIGEPGGGQKVTLVDPDGFRIEVVHGVERLPQLAIDGPEVINDAHSKLRLGIEKRIRADRSHVKRCGHVVVNVTDFRASEAWYKERFGFLSSDDIYLGDESLVVASFMRCDMGPDTYVDHHTFLCVGSGTPEFNHAAWEVCDLDDLMRGHDTLATKEYQHAWGIGRHILGSQIFDYWRDPWGRTHEHWIDGDLFTSAKPSGLHPAESALASQWGPQAPPDF
jgi:catechol 2,3-dioxygenase-like lactoylglutathione lyase family enzyme